MINMRSAVSIIEANQDFSKVAKLVDQKGSAIITKNNTPKYLVIELKPEDIPETAPDEVVAEISKRFMAVNKNAYEVLASCHK